MIFLPVTNMHEILKNTFTLVEDSLGKPFIRTPTSVDVPPISTITASFAKHKYAAPLILFVAPDEKVCTGYSNVSFSLLKKQTTIEIVIANVINSFQRNYINQKGKVLGEFSCSQPSSIQIKRMKN